jgi:putative FmdB family regulatory protein
MPLYEYECFLCHHRFERIQRVSADPVEACPECGGAVRRLLGTPALQFKGSGWYVTDYGNGRSRGTTETANGETEKSTTKSADPPAAEDTPAKAAESPD